MAKSNGMGKGHPVVSHDEWLAAGSAFLTTEKEFTRARDKLSRQRRELPWEKVEKEYSYEAVGGPETLATLFVERYWSPRSRAGAGGGRGGIGSGAGLNLGAAALP